MKSKKELIRTLINSVKITEELNQADHVICMSDILREACQVAGVEPGKITVLGNRVSTQRFCPLPQKNYHPRVIRALFVGRLQEQKNIHGIAEALVRLREEGWKISLEVCGGWGVNAYLREATSALKPSEWRYRGNVPNRKLPAVYQRVDMYVGPSFYEGFQIPLIEALACGKPCVASDQPPANEILTPEVGALVDPSDPDSIAAGILWVKNRLNDPREGLRMRAACRVLALQKWDYFVISRQEVNLYVEVLNKFRCGR